MEEKVVKLEPVTHAFTRKVLSLETELTEIMNKNKSNEVVQGKGKLENIKEIESAGEKDTWGNKLSNEGISFKPKENYAISKQYEKRDNIKDKERYKK